MTEEQLVQAAVGFVRDDDLNYEALVLQDPTSGDTFHVQRSLRHDSQDAAAGMDTYCLVRGGATYYGGLAGWRLEGPRLELVLEPSAAQVLELPEVVALDVNRPQLVEDHLPRLTTLA